MTRDHKAEFADALFMLVCPWTQTPTYDPPPPPEMHERDQTRLYQKRMAEQKKASS